MRVQLINPPVYLNVHALTALRPSMPLGLAYIAAALRRDGHRISVVDAVAAAPDRVTQDGPVYRLGLSPEEIVARLDGSADCFAITNMWSFSWPLVRAIIQQVKARYPRIPIVAGGEHFTGLPEHSLRQAPIDCIVLGEGEETAVEVFRAVAAGAPLADIRGVAFLRDGQFVRTPNRDRTRAVDDLPWPAWDLFDLEVYNQHDLVTGLHAGMTVPILATRGCPYQCTYCSSPNMWTTRWYARDPKDVADEIEQNLKVHGATNFPFQDLTAILKRDWVIAFSSEIINRKLNITWQLPAGTRSEIVDDEVARLLYASGCRSVNFAPESGSERTRKHMKKMLTDEKLFRAVNAAVKNGLNVGCFLVLGYPTDDASDMKATTKMIRRLARAGVDDVSAGFFFPLPSTEIYYELEKQGKVKMSDDFLKLPIYVHNKFMTSDRVYTPHLTAKQMTRWKYWIVANFYLTSFFTRPLRVFKIFGNFLRGRETSKMESFLQETRRKFSLRFGKKQSAEAKPEPKRPTAAPTGA